MDDGDLGFLPPSNILLVQNSSLSGFFSHIRGQFHVSSQCTLIRPFWSHIAWPEDVMLQVLHSTTQQTAAIIPFHWIRIWIFLQLSNGPYYQSSALLQQMDVSNSTSPLKSLGKTMSGREGDRRRSHGLLNAQFQGVRRKKCPTRTAQKVNIIFNLI